MYLAKNIRYLRKKNNMSQEYIADKLGYKSYTTIQKWEMGVSEPPIGKLRALADLFGVDINDMTNVNLELNASNPKYYTDEKTAKMAQEMFEDPDMRSLFDMKHNMDPDKFKLHVDYLRKMYKLEHPEDDDDGGC